LSFAAESAFDWCVRLLSRPQVRWSLAPCPVGLEMSRPKSLGDGISTYRHSGKKSRRARQGLAGPQSTKSEMYHLSWHMTQARRRTSGKLNPNILRGVVGFAPRDFSQEVRMKKVLLVLTLVGLGFLAWRYFSNEPV